MKSKIRAWLISYKKPIIECAVISFVVVVGILWVLFHPTKHPVPAYIKKEVNFVIIYPAGDSILSSSWKYDTRQASLSFTTQGDNYKAVFTEEQVPLEFQNDTASYNRFIGSLRPFANFNVPLGAVTLANFVTAGDLQPVGQTGILNTKNTFLLVHPSHNLSDNQWRSLFGSLKTDT